MFTVYKCLRLLSLAVLGVPAIVGAQQAGTTLLVIPPAFIENADGIRDLQQNTVLSVGDRISTRSGGYVHIRMLDGGLLAIRPQSTIEIEVFSYDPKAPEQGRVRYKLHEGTSRSVTGAIGQANKEGFRFNTPVAAIGVRGTDFVASTTIEHTAVNVNRGAIVIAALGPSCSANGFGTCSVNSLLLASGGNSGFAEVSVSNPTPRLRHDLENSPGKKAPAHPSEPLALLDDTRNAGSADSAAALATAPSIVAQTKVPGNVIVPVTPAVPVPPPAASVVFWGRWDAGLKDVSGSTVAELGAEGKTVHLANWLFGLGVDSLPGKLPASGNASFVVAGGDAYLRLANGSMQAASVVNGNLNVNFATAQFSVNTDVSARNQTYPLYAAGSVDSRGYLISRAAQSNAQISTVLGADLTQAGSLFTKPLDDGSTLLGAISWRK